jgi:hypothetical protein
MSKAKQDELKERMKQENEARNKFNKHPCYQLSQDSLKCTMSKDKDCTEIQKKWKECMKDAVSFILF